MRHACWTVALASVAALTAAPAAGQVSINPYIGYLHFDESSFEEAFRRSDLDSKPPFLGVRLGLGGNEGWSFDLGYGRAGVEGELVLDDIVMTEEATIQLFYGALNWHLPIPVLDLFLSGGAGASRYSPEERDSRTSVLLNYGAGASIPIGRMRVRADVKDHVVFCEAPESDVFSDFADCFDDATRHDIEISAGLEIPL